MVITYNTKYFLIILINKYLFDTKIQNIDNRYNKLSFDSFLKGVKLFFFLIMKM